MSTTQRQADLVAAITGILLRELPLVIYLGLGLAGVLWIGDDFDTLRLTTLSYAGVPLAIGYYGSRCLWPGWRRRRPTTHLVAVVLMIVFFATGVLPLLNAVTAEERVVKRTLSHGIGLVTRDVRRGGLGMLFKPRW